MSTPDQILEGVFDNGTCIEIARWSSDDDDYDAQGWLDKFGDRVGSGSARTPDGAWVDLSRFCIIRQANP